MPDLHLISSVTCIRVDMSHTPCGELTSASAHGERKARKTRCQAQCTHAAVRFRARFWVATFALIRLVHSAHQVRCGSPCAMYAHGQCRSFPGTRSGTPAFSNNNFKIYPTQ
jgi:hypothetical protein